MRGLGVFFSLFFPPTFYWFPFFFSFFPLYGLLLRRATGFVFRAAISQEGFGSGIPPAKAVSCSHPSRVSPQFLSSKKRQGLKYSLIASFSLFKNQVNLHGIFVSDGVSNMSGKAIEQAVSRENTVYGQAAQELCCI